MGEISLDQYIWRYTL